MKLKKIAAVALAVMSASVVGGCASSDGKDETDENIEIVESEPEISDPAIGDNEEINTPTDAQPDNPQDGEKSSAEVQPPVAEEEPPVVKEEEVQPQVQTAKYICVTADNVNIRSGAGTNYSVSGTAERETLYAYEGKSNGWYKTKYKNKTVYISSKYCVVVDMEASDNPKIEAVIAAGTSLLGTPYVYGAVRLHDGTGRFLSGFTVNAFDCSSLMQYMFYYGADTLLQVNTRTQVYQGKTVSKSQLRRGDLMFFTNASRYNKTGIERIGHVAIYLGDNYILHTSSDYAKIEQISAQRWSYFIQAQRII